MAILSYKKGLNVSLSPHFTSTEFDCSCPQCTETKIDQDLITRLEALRAQTGPLKITSGYRCSHYQAELRLAGYETALGVSQHELGRAADVAGAGTLYTGGQLALFAYRAGFMAIGIAPTWAHLDLRDDKERRWLYKK